MEEDPKTSPLQAAPGRKRRYRFVMFLVAGIAVTGCAAWFSIAVVHKKWKAREARELVSQANLHWQAGELDKALPLLRKALGEFPSDPQVIRLVALCCDQLPDGADTALIYWRKLQQLGATTWEDNVALGRAYLRVDQLNPAQEIADALPEEVRDKRKAMEFQAAILTRNGRLREAEALLRKVWSAHSDEPECRMQLACLNTASTSPEVREAAFTALWEIARGDGKVSAMAISALAVARGHSPSQRAELISLIGKSKDFPDARRYAVLDSCIGKSSELMEAAIIAARMHLPRNQPAARARFYKWLAEHQQADLILKEVSEHEALSFGPLFMPYVDALLRKERWADLQRVLSQPTLPISKVDLALFSAIVARERKESTEAVRAHIQAATLYACTSRKPRELTQAGLGAEAFGYPDIAIQAYSVLADRQSVRIDTLKRIYRLQKQRSDGLGMLITTRELLRDRPGLPPYADSELYLQLIVGIDLEDAVQKLIAKEGGNNNRLPIWCLSRALAAYHMGDSESMVRSLDMVAASGLDPGQRAVFAGLLRSAGRTAEATAVVQGIMSNQILPEEQWFMTSPDL